MDGSRQIMTKLRDWAIWQARAGCYSQAALSSNDSKTLYTMALPSVGLMIKKGKVGLTEFGMTRGDVFDSQCWLLFLIFIPT